jgi:hypothetical protein
LDPSSSGGGCRGVLRPLSKISKNFYRTWHLRGWSFPLRRAQTAPSLFRLAHSSECACQTSQAFQLCTAVRSGLCSQASARPPLRRVLAVPWCSTVPSVFSRCGPIQALARFLRCRPLHRRVRFEIGPVQPWKGVCAEHEPLSKVRSRSSASPALRGAAAHVENQLAKRGQAGTLV